MSKAAETTATEGAAASGELLELYERMSFIRALDELTMALFERREITGTALHVATGQESCPVAVSTHRRDADVMFSTHRGSAHCLAWGADPVKTIAEVLGRAGGFASGLGGHMHIVDPDSGVLGTNGIVGGGLPLAVGAALGLRMQGVDAIAVAYFGDGAANTGACHEAMNLAQVWDAPVLFVCENNRFAEMTYSDALTAGTVAGRARAYGIPATEVDATDVRDVVAAAGELIAGIRGGGGPALLDCESFRMGGHFVGDAQHYREEEVEGEGPSDPIAAARTVLAESGGDAEALTSADERAVSRAEAVLAEVMAMPKPGIEDLERMEDR
jgi:acetoin:2,6-dichlorophenolindophenol oxidoreductase subunit alpha